MKDLITEARELCEKATEGPWEAGSYGAVCLKSGFKLGNIEGSGNAAFIARSRTLIPELCDALDKAEEQNKQLLHEVCKLARESVEREKVLATLEAEVEDALREKQERSGCEFCQQGEEMAYGQDSMKRTAYIYLDGNLLVADFYSKSMAAAVCYCPMCGKRLEEHHETD